MYVSNDTETNNLSDTTQANTISDGTDYPYDEDPVLISAEGLKIIQIVNHVILSGLVCLFGIIANIINIVIFIKQGLDSTVNISMFAIAVSDLCSLITLEWLNMNLNPFMENADVPWEPSEVQYLTGGWPHACFLQITIWITIYVTVERFVCIAVPLKVKLIFTTFRTKVIITVNFLLMFIALIPEYIYMYFGENFYPARNQTRVGLRTRSHLADLDGVVFMLFAVMGFGSYGLLIVFTCLLVGSLKRGLTFHQTSTSDKEKIQVILKKGRKTMKMTGMIAILLIICTTPGMTFSALAFSLPGFDLAGKYRNIFHTCYSVAFLAEAINSSVNIFLFYKMSSKFRKTLKAQCIPKWAAGSEDRSSQRSARAREIPTVSAIVKQSREDSSTSRTALLK